MESCAGLGFTYCEMEKQDGTHIAVVEVRCRFKAPALTTNNSRSHAP